MSQINPMEQLEQGAVHLWFVRPQEIKSEAVLNGYQRLLSTKEREKQQRYVFAEDRHDALITRAFIRSVLSHYLQLKPEGIQFTIGDKGKPELDTYTHPEQRLKFNISHTRELIICAICYDVEIGCDVEQTSRNSDVLSIAHRFFSPLETKEMFSLDELKQRDRFFDYWTLKESYIKAWGLGLAIPLDEFSFLLECDSNISEQFVERSDIKLSFSQKRNDQPEHWQNWLCYPSVDYRIAVSLRNPEHLTKSRKNISEQISVFEFSPAKREKKMNVAQFCALDLRCSEQKMKRR